MRCFVRERSPVDLNVLNLFIYFLSFISGTSLMASRIDEGMVERDALIVIAFLCTLAIPIIGLLQDSRDPRFPIC